MTSQLGFSSPNTAAIGDLAVAAAALGDVGDPIRLAELSDVVAGRRSNLRVDPERPVAPEVVAHLLRLAQQAPNHRRLWPLRAAVLTGGARHRFGDTLAEAVAQWSDDPAKVAKIRRKYVRSPVLVALATASHSDPSVAAEHRLTGGAAAQNFLLGAHAARLAGFWASAPAGTEAVVCRFLGWPLDTDLVGLFYLGWPIDSAPPVTRPEVPTQWLSE